MPTHAYDEDIAHHPHDGLVKRIFTNPEIAAVELQQVLPAALCARLDWSSLEVDPSSFIDSKLKPRHSDILYSIALRGSDRRVSIYVVLEHQSKPDARMAARFVVYVGRLYERHMREHQNDTTVPLVVPVLLYQGPSGWTMPRRLSEMLDVPPEMLDAFPSPVELAFAVDDLQESVLGQQVSRDQLERERGLAQTEMARTLLWLYFHPEATTGDRATTLGLLLEFIADTWGAHAVQPFITYFISAFERDSPLHGILTQSLSPETRHMYITIREQLLAEGRAKGEAEGRAKGMARMVERLLDARELPLTDNLRKRLVACTDATLLQRWFDRAVTATSLTEVFDD